LKTLDFAGGVNVTLGLPIVRTSPDHGTALDLAGHGKPIPTKPFIAALAARLRHGTEARPRVTGMRTACRRCCDVIASRSG